jgi:poly [ADP-ribose] polymerase 2/3/4
MAIVKEIRLIMSDVDANCNKHWTGQLFDNGDIKTIWGRVGKTEDSKIFPGAGEKFLEKKRAEKVRKGYRELRVVCGNSSKEVQTGELATIARNQIQTTKPELQKLIDRLVQANIHKITTSTNITYNDTTGLFSTPLGIVTLDAIKEARHLLAEIQKFVKVGTYADKKLSKAVGEYLMLVPQNVGMKLNIQALFPDLKSIENQQDILQSLESSYEAFQKGPKDTTSKQPEEKVFDVLLDLVEDGAEIDRITKFFKSTVSYNHISSKLKIRQIYSLTLTQMAEAFKEGSKVGNIMELWHGSKVANLLSIIKSGLKVSPPSTAAIVGRLFGNGVYFSDQSTKSLNYAYGYWDGKYEKECFMLLNQVAMGKSYTPKSTYETSYPVKGYDSVFAKGGVSGVANNEMIVYQNNQINITHLVEFAE